MTVQIKPGVFMPMLGLGTWQVTDTDVLYNIIDAALASGYRFIDTAAIYGNEKTIGNALKELLPKYGLDRKDIFITSKLSTRDQGKDHARQGALKSLENLQMDFLDLYIIHFPGASGVDSSSPLNAQMRRESWLELEKLEKEGKFRAIGVSNYLINHLSEMNSYASQKPALNQCEYHPHLLRKDLVDYCKSEGIHFQAYSSLGTAANKERLFSEPEVKELAAKYQCTIPQLLLAWSINQGISVLPKSTKPENVKSNFKALEIRMEPDDINILMKLNQDSNYCWNPANIA